MPESSNNPPYRYWAFISYNHEDKSWGQWLHRAIETYGIPADLVDRHTIPTGHSAPKRFHPSYLDREETRAAPDLHLEIEEALRDSHSLIVVCSPNAVKSPWVNTEIEIFQKLGRDNRIFAIIVGGEPNAGGDDECFPPALRNRKLIAADARPESGGKNNAKLKILAGMLAVKFDALKQRDKRRRVQRASWLAMAVVVALAGTTLMLTKLQRVEQTQREIAKKIKFLPDETDILRSRIEAAKASMSAGASLGEAVENMSAGFDSIPKFYWTEDGDSLASISKKFDISIDELLLANTNIQKLGLKPDDAVPARELMTIQNAHKKKTAESVSTEWCYLTRNNESLIAVAQKFGVKVDALRESNADMQEKPGEFFVKDQILRQGVVLRIPNGPKTGTFVWLNNSSYVGEHGTTLSELAKRLNTTPENVLALNPEFLANSNLYFAANNTFRPSAVWTLRIPPSSEPPRNLPAK